MSHRRIVTLLSLVALIASTLAVSAGPASVADESSITLDGALDADYVQIATDPAGDLASPGPADWTGTQWTDLTALHVAADSSTLYVYAELPGYFEDPGDPGNDSSGQIGLVLDVDGVPGSGGAGDAWGNAITFAFQDVDGFSTAGTFLPDYLIRGDVSNDGGWTELRTWAGDWNTGAGTNWGGISGGDVGTNVAYADGQGVELAIPLADIGGPDPAQVRLQFFATQGGPTKGAFDTVPSDDQSTGWDDPTTHANLVTVPLAVDPAGDLASPGPADWVGVAWTDVTRLHAWTDAANLHLYLPMPAYDDAVSAGQIGLAVDTGPGGGSADPWGNAITFAYANTHQNLGSTPVAEAALPDYVIRGNTFGPSDNGWTELRTWNGTDFDTGGGTDWGGIGNTGAGSQPGSKVAWNTGDGLRLRIPFADIGVAAGDTVSLQFFGTQGGGSKGAYDTVPADDQSTGWDDPTTQQFLATLTIPGDGGGGTAEPGDELLVTPPVRKDVQDRVFYFVMPDRFDNGDPTNDTAGSASADPLVHGYLPTHKGYYHGGDLAGLIARLPYLDSLGVTAIWLTPQFKNDWIQGDGTIGGSSAGYHGYWQIDYSQIDPHFGSNAEMVALVDAAHALGIDVFFDIVANHTGDVITYVEGTRPPYVSKADQPFLDASGVPFDDRDFAGTGTFPPLDPNVSFPYTPTFAPGDETVKFPDFLDDPIYYHNRGESTFSGESSLYGDFVGLDDLFTEHPVVQDGMIQVFKDMVTDFDVDGFRIDTVKHVNDEFWEAFGPELEAHAASLGKDDFFFFGEVFDFGVPFLSRFSTDLPLHSTLDFAFQGTARNFASQSGPTTNAANLYAADDYYTDADSNAYQLPLFIGNHDIGRFGLFVNQDNPGATDAELLARDVLGHALMFFGRGMPVVYYGDEQGFVGDGGDQDARQDMMPSVVPSYVDDDNIGTAATPADSNFDQTHPLYATLSDFSDLLDAHPALTRGAQLQRYSEPSAGILAFSRIERTEKVEYVVVLNNAESPDSASFETASPAATFTELWPGSGPAIASDASGNLTVAVPALDFRIYRADAPHAVPTVPPVVTMTSPAAGAEVTGRVEVGASMSLGSPTEVTFAVSVDGGPFEVIGVDDNSPYRVFYDVSGLAAGTPLVFKAIADNMSGDISSDKVAVTVGSEEPPTFGGFDYAVIHYNRPAGDYGDHTTGDFNDFWGLHLWGDAIDPAEVTDWPNPKPFLGEDEFGRFAWIRRGGDDSQVNFIIHQGDTKDGTEDDRFFDADLNPEIWVNQGDATIYTSQAAAQGFVTIRYHRDDGDYGTPSPDFNTFWGLHLWGDAIDPAEGTTWTSPKPPDGIDDFGAFWTVDVVDVTQPVNFIIHRGDEKDPGPDESFIPEEIPTAWKVSGDTEVYPSRGAAQDFATIHYHRDDGDYGDPTSPDFNDFWGMHVWEGAASPNPAWQDPVRPDSFDVFGPKFVVDLVDGAPQLAYILHRGDTKDPGPDQFLVLGKWGHEVWQLEGEHPSDPEQPHYVLPIVGPAATPGDLAKRQAHWVSEDTIVWAAAGDPARDHALCHAPTGGMTLSPAGVDGGTCIDLDLGAPFPSGVDGFRHLGGLPTLKLPAAALPDVPAILTGQLAVVATQGGIRVGATGLQIPGVLDDLYATDVPLGAVFESDPTLRLWAPTAKNVTLHLFDDADPATLSTIVPMTWDAATGAWSAEGDASWVGKYYLYEVEVFVHSTGQVEHNVVTDPYSVSLSMNSQRSQIVDLSDSSLAPQSWDSVAKPPLAQFEEIAIYELHVRDFSANDATVPDELKGTYSAFTLDGTAGMNHLEDLAEAGLTHLHLLPAFDIATIDEDKSTWQSPDPAVLETFPPDSEQQQAAVEATADLDGFNWGYDPFHYTAPEGSYSTDPDGTTRIVEFREMVKSLNEAGLRVVMDVVYNHTNAAGQADKSVLDRIVPGYYHRLNGDGVVETSTCCPNTATEHAMMGRLMVDSVVTWAKEYKVDGFRFDLMGHHSIANMLEVRAALDALTLADDGVDGSKIYVYGEGWNFGEVANDARFVQATQLNLGGTGIGTFSDRLRDAVRGGGPFDGGTSRITNQGFVNGLVYDPNAQALPAAQAEAEMLLSADQIRVGLAGNLAGYEFEAADGTTKRGDQIDYNGSPAGYTEDPQENIVYVSAHDNETLFDVSQYKHPVATSTADRARAQNVGIAITALAQGVNFFHAGVDLLRSKSMDRDSFNSGDWFNRLDWTYQDNNWGVGLPVASKNQPDWPVMQPFLADPALDPAPTDIGASVAAMQEFLEIRGSSPLFSLETAADVQDRVAFHNTGPGQVQGLIVMSLSDEVGDDLDPAVDEVMVLFNATDDFQSFAVPATAGEEWALHPVQQASADPVVQSSWHTQATGTFNVPPRTTAVFVTDITPPVVEAGLSKTRGSSNAAWFEVSFSCSDASGVAVSAAINGVEVQDGEQAQLTKVPPAAGTTWNRDARGRLHIRAAAFAMTIDCVDGAGNTTTEVVPAPF